MGNESVKPYKVRTAHRNVQRVGVVASSLDGLLKTACRKLKIGEATGCRLVLEEDATAINSERYFQQLPPQTVFVLLSGEQQWRPRRASPRDVLNQLLDFNQSRLADELAALLRDDKSQDHLNLLQKMLTSLELTSTKETREDDPNWFEGVESRFTRKEDVMREGARRRVRSYLYSATRYIDKSDVVKETSECAVALQTTCDLFLATLRGNGYHGDYFGRRLEGGSGDVGSGDIEGAFCDGDGWFRCEGRFDRPLCGATGHMINPYGSREARIIFSTWNLDHRVEKSRSICPALVDAHLNTPGGQRVNWRYFYSMLFTRENLKLVHIACHDKRQHKDYQCDPAQFFVPL